MCMIEKIMITEGFDLKNRIGKIKLKTKITNLYQPILLVCVQY